MAKDTMNQEIMDILSPVLGGSWQRRSSSIANAR